MIVICMFVDVFLVRRVIMAIGGGRKGKRREDELAED